MPKKKMMDNQSGIGIRNLNNTLIQEQHAGNGYLTESRRFESVPGTNRPCELVACDKHGRGGWLKAERNQPI